MLTPLLVVSARRRRVKNGHLGNVRGAAGLTFFRLALRVRVQDRDGAVPIGNFERVEKYCIVITCAICAYMTGQNAKTRGGRWRRAEWWTTRESGSGGLDVDYRADRRTPALRRIGSRAILSAAHFAPLLSAL